MARTRHQLSLELDGTKLFEIRTFENHLFDVLKDEDSGKVPVSRLIKHMRSVGLWRNDPRLKDTMDSIRKLNSTTAGEPDISNRDPLVDRSTFVDIIKSNVTLIQKAFSADLVIPEFKSFTDKLDALYDVCKENKEGEVASYIPQLKRYSPNYWGVSVCTVDGQRHSRGDVRVAFPLQSTSKPISYALVLNELGEEVVHKYVGHEPSGETFNQIKLGHGNKPHNPLINAGAIVTGSLLKKDLSLADRFDYVSQQVKALAGGGYTGFNNAVFLSERETADRNFALAYYMNENKCFPAGTRLQEVLDFYFMLCSIEVNVESASVIAATLANGGLCPITGEQILDAVSVRNTLSLMHSCGMYDYSGEFAFKVGLPAKSGVSGAILLVIPNVAGLCLWSPPLDSYGNSVRAVQYCQELVKMFNFHHYDNLKNTPDKMDPRVRPSDVDGAHIVQLLFAAFNGDLTAIRRMALAGKVMSVNDYDGRTALHLAAAEGHLECLQFLLETCNVPAYPKDRWGHTPYDDAKIFEREDLTQYLESYLGYTPEKCGTQTGPHLDQPGTETGVPMEKPAPSVHDAVTETLKQLSVQDKN